MKSELSEQSSKKYSDIKFHENPFNVSRFVPGGQINGSADGRADIKKMIVAFRNFAYVHIKEKIFIKSH